MCTVQQVNTTHLLDLRDPQTFPDILRQPLYTSKGFTYSTTAVDKEDDHGNSEILAI